MSIQAEIKKMTVPHLIQMKQNNQKIAALTAYDALMANLLDESGIDLILVGDSAAMVMGGHPTTLPISLFEMLLYTKNVSRGIQRALLIADMPFLSYQASIKEGIKNAGRFLKEGGAEAVKIEGGKHVVKLVKRLVDCGIPVMGHLGLTPQSIHQYGGYKLQGKETPAAQQILEDAHRLTEAGIFSLVLEKIPFKLAETITAALPIPTIGIGAGPYCDGQILVSHDMLGIFDAFKPKFVRRYAELSQLMRQAFKEYINEVKTETFPNLNESFE